MEGNKAFAIGKAVHYGIEHGSAESALDFMEKDEFFLGEDAETNKVIVMAMVDAYLAKFGRHSTTQYEVHFTLNVLNKDEPDFQGFVDEVQEVEDGYWIIENKTASRVDEAYVEKLAFTDQVSKYYLGLQKILDKPILGVKYRIIKKPALRLKNSESISEFRQRLVERLMEEDNIIEVITTRSKADLKEALAELKADMRTIVRAKVFPKNPQACSMFGKCQYLPLCAKHEDAEFLFDKFEEKEEENADSQE